MAKFSARRLVILLLSFIATTSGSLSLSDSEMKVPVARSQRWHAEAWRTPYKPPSPKPNQPRQFIIKPPPPPTLIY